MRIGCCCNIEEAPIAHAAGYDFIECKIIALRPDERDEAVTHILAQHQASPLPIAAWNVFLPRDLKIVGDEVDGARVAHYVENGLRRAKMLGGEIVVFGSGVARSIPDGFSTEVARRQTIDFLQLVGDTAARHGITVVIEPLNRKESNTIFTVDEAVELARAVNRPQVQVLADFYHMDEEQEPLSHLSDYAPWLKHIHVADTERRAPGTGRYPYAEFAAHLHHTQYKGMVSIECRWLDFEAEAGPALAFLRKTLE